MVQFCFSLLFTHSIYAFNKLQAIEKTFQVFENLIKTEEFSIIQTQQMKKDRLLLSIWINNDLFITLLLRNLGIYKNLQYI